MDMIWIVAAAGAALVLIVVLLLMARGKERVIDMGGSSTATAEPDTPSKAAANADDQEAIPTSPGEILEFQGKDDPECGLADWLMDDISRTFGGDYSLDRLQMTRVAEAALKASAELKATGRATVDLPYLAADASGPKSYRRDVVRAEAELGMIEHGVLMVDELIQWRGRDERSVGLAEWLQAEVDEECGDIARDAPSVQRLADAVDQAMADIARAGRAVIDLPGLPREAGGVHHFRYQLDRAKLAALLGED